MNYASRRAPHYSTLTLRGVSHGVTRWGDPEGAPVVLLHGWGDSGETFQFLVDAFDTDRSWIALDWRGFGRSEWTGPAYWFADYLADLDAFLNSQPLHERWRALEREVRAEGGAAAV